MVPHWKRWHALHHAEIYKLAALKLANNGGGLHVRPERPVPKAGSWERLLEATKLRFRHAVDEARAAYDWETRLQDQMEGFQ